MNKGSILIAEDSEDIREILSTYLSSKHYAVAGVDNGFKAIGQLEERMFDLIISDINMPGIDGLELLDRAKQITPHTPFVLITGFPSMENAIQAIRKGAADYITKPFNFNQIDMVLERFIKDKPSYAPTKIDKAADQTQNEIIEELNEKLNLKVQELSKLYHISESICHINDEETLFQQVVEVASEVTHTDQVYLLFRDGESGEFFIKTSNTKDKKNYVPKDTYAEGSALLEMSMTLRPVSSSGRREIVLKLGNQIRTLKSFLLAPLIVKRQLFGAILISGAGRPQEFNKEDELILMDVSQKMTLTLENSILYQTLYMHVINTLQALVASVEAKDSYTERHSYRVTQMAKQVAKYMGCSSSEIDSLEFAGLLHDIGKIGVRDMVLMKRGRLTESEWLEIRRHPEIGESIVQPLKLFSLEASIIRHHHERWDGRGYPDGLSTTSIPFLSRIITVTDSFDAMVSNRPYRSGKAVQQALDELIRCKSSQFDPQIVDVFVDLFRKDLDDETWQKALALESM